MDLDRLRDAPARSGDNVFLVRRGELTGVTSSPDPGNPFFLLVWSESFSSGGRSDGDEPEDNGGSGPGTRAGLASILGGIEPKTDSIGGADGVGEAAPDSMFIESSNEEPAGPGVG